MASFTANPLGRAKLVKSLVTIVFCMVVGYAHLTTKTDSRQKQRLQETKHDGASRSKNVDRFIKGILTLH